MADDNQAGQTQNGDGDPKPDLLPESNLGKKFVGLPGVLAIAAYLMLLSLVISYVMIEVWPPSSPEASKPSSLPGASSGTAAPPAGTATPPGGTSTTGTPPGTTAPPAGSPAAGAPTGTATSSPGASSPGGTTAGTTSQTTVSTSTAEPEWDVHFFWSPEGCKIRNTTALFLIAILAGALGSLLHSLRSLYWYTGNRKLVWSWSLMFILLPFCGAALSLIFYIVIRGGLLPQSNLSNGNPFGFAAVGATVGLFSEQAILKLKQVAETLFTSPQHGKDTALPPPKVVSISPVSGAGGISVTITGTGFANGAKVNIGGTPATAVVVASATSITAVTPAHQAGPADVEIVNQDNQKDVLKGGFTYK